jgi:hypothetical protein
MRPSILPPPIQTVAEGGIGHAECVEEGFFVGSNAPQSRLGSLASPAWAAPSASPWLSAYPA